LPCRDDFVSLRNPPAAAVRGTVTRVGGVVGPVRWLTLVRPYLTSAPTLGDGQCVRSGRPLTSSVGESDTCMAEFG
jgi:hypothetical protein